MLNGTTTSTSPTQNPNTDPDALPQPDDGDGSPTRLCLVVGGDPAYEFAAMHRLPIRTLCGEWLNLDQVDDPGIGVAGGTVDCAMCDLMLERGGA